MDPHFISILSRGRYDHIVHCIRDNFINLQLFEDHFRHTLNLFNFAAAECQKHDRSGPNGASDRGEINHAQWMDTGQMLNAWLHIAARDGIMCIFHFDKVAKFLNGDIKRVPQFSTPEIRQRMGDAHSLRNKYFPRIEGLRNIAAHLGEATQASRTQKNAFTGELQIGDSTQHANSISLIGVLAGTKYMVTYKNTVLSCDISRETLRQINEVKLAYYSIFGPLREFP